MVLVPASSDKSLLSLRHVAWVVSALPLLGLAFAPGCGDETETQDPGIAVEKFAEEYQQAACEHAVACNYMPDVETCLASVAPSPRAVHGVAAVTSGDITYDANAAKTCVDAVRAASCTEGVLFPRALAETCDAVFGGRKAEGDACYHSIECEGVDAVCEGECFDSCCAGTCRTTEGVAQIGEECSGEKPCVVNEAFCGSDPMTGMPVCLARIAAGQTCPGQGTCTIGNECDPASGTCFKQAPAGGTCNPSISAQVCSNIGEYCDPMDSVCKPYPGVGEPCTSGGGCANFAFCDGANATCVTRPKVGEPCPANFCMGSLSCSAEDGTGTCGALPATVTCQ